MATNMGLFLARHTGKKVVLVDLDLQFGEVSTALRLRPDYTIYDALHRDDADGFEFGEHLDEFLVEHERGFSVLAAPMPTICSFGIESLGTPFTFWM